MADASLAARVRAVLHYDPATGVFTRRVRLAQRHHAGDRADTRINTGPLEGYRRVGFDSARYLAHRLAWLYVHGDWPEHFIDHINGDRGDNRIENLRDATPRINAENKRRPMVTSRCDVLGVHLHSDGTRWRARIQVNGRSKHIGLYSTKEAAHEAYLETKRKLHPGCTI